MLSHFNEKSAVGAFRDHAQQQMTLAMNHHLSGAMAFDPLIKGGMGVCGIVAGAAVVGPAAGFAMYAGWHEWKEAAENAKKFKERERNLRLEQSLTHKLSPKSLQKLGPLTQAFDAAAARRIADNEIFATASKLGGRIGKYSFLSGTAIVARIAVELLRNAGAGTLCGTPQPATDATSGAIAPSFLMETGITSNALASLASSFAVMLGVNFVRKAGTMRKIWKADTPRVAHKKYKLDDPQSAYGRFLKEKIAHRMKFIHSFYWKNKMFLAGAGLYALGTILPTCIKLLAAAGILSSKKVGAKLILALFATGIAGALTMGLFSHQFFYGHPQLERYEQYALKDTEEFDQRFLTNIDMFAFKKDEQGGELDSRAVPPYAVRQGLAMRESTFNCLQNIEGIRQELLQNIACQTDRVYTHIAHIGDADYQEHRPFNAKRKMLFSGMRLRVKDVEQWLHSPANKKLLLKSFGKITASKIALLEQADSIHALHEVVALQGASTDQSRDKNQSLEHKLATHVLKHMPASYNHARGMLLEAERQAKILPVFR